MGRSWSLRAWLPMVILWIASGSLSRAQDEPVYDLTIEGPSTLPGWYPGRVVSAEYTCYLTHSGAAAPSGGSAQGWSISLSADSATITSIQTGIGAGDPPLTDAAVLYSGGFNKSEVTTSARTGSGCEGKNGAVSAVVLSFTEGTTLPADAKSSIAVLNLEVTVPEGVATTRLYYVDGCKGVGQPVDNNVTHDGRSVKPSLGTLEIRIPPCCPPPCGSRSLSLGFSAGPVRVIGGDPAALIDELVGTGEPGDPGELGAYGEVATVYAGIVSPFEDGGTDAVQGWSLSLALEGDGELLEAGVENTAAAPVADGGYFEGGFYKTEIVDPMKEPTSGPLAGRGPQGPGVVSAVVLSFTTGATLPKRGVESVLRMTVRSTAWMDLGSTATLRFKSGLQGIGQPVNNVATINGNTAQFCNTRSAELTLRFGCCVPLPTFLRGNANDDAKVDIADPVWIINELFRGGPPSMCQDAADANDDGSVDTSDAVFLIDYEFRGGSMPPAPFPDCGMDPDGDDDGLTCEQYQAVCS